MPYYRVAGEIPAKHQVRFHRADEALHAAERMGEEGLSADSAPNHPLSPRHFTSTGLPRGGDLVLGGGLLFANDDVRISVVTVGDTSGLYRNSTGRETI